MSAPLSCVFCLLKVREWFAEVQRRLKVGSDPFLEPEAGRTEGNESTKYDGEMEGERSAATKEQTGSGLGDEDDDEEYDEDDGDETDDSELWEPSRSVRKSLSVSED